MNFSEGDFFYIEEKNLFSLFKVLRTGEDPLVRSYWPEPEMPTVSGSASLHIERACRKPDFDFSHAVKIGNEPVSENDRQEIGKFLEIQSGLARRQTQLREIMHSANELFGKENWLEAMHLYTEAASFARNNPEIFEKRGKCFAELGMESEARADRAHAQQLRA